LDLTVDRADILRALQTCATLADKAASVIPIIRSVLLIATDDSLTISATNTEVTLRLACPARIREAGALVIDLVTLKDFLGNLPEDSAILTHAGGKFPLKIESGTTKFSVPIVKLADDYPTLPVEEPTKVPFAVDDVTAVADAYRAVVYAIGDGVRTTGDGTILAKGVSIIADADRIEFCATDGLRLAITTMHGSTPSDARDITPPAAIRALAKFSGSAQFYIGDRHTFIRFMDGSMLAYRRFDTKFPDYSRHRKIALNSESALTLERKRLADAVRRALILTPSDRGVEIMAAMGRLTVRPMKAERGEGSDTMPYEGDSGLRFEASGPYMLQALDAMDDETITMAQEGAVIVLRPVVSDLDAPETMHGFGTCGNY